MSNPFSSIPLHSNPEYVIFIGRNKRCVKCGTRKCQDFPSDVRNKCKRCIDIEAYEKKRAQLISEGKPIIIHSYLSSPVSSTSSPSNTSPKTPKMPKYRRI
jgi:hypothetical protein